MSLSSNAKEAIRLATTAGLGKDVIDLLTQKVTLLDEKLTDTRLSLDQATIKITDLIRENKDLRSKLAKFEDKSDRLPEPTREALQLLFDAGDEVPLSSITQRMALTVSEAKFHLGELLELGFIGYDQGSVGFGVSDAFGESNYYEGSPEQYYIKHKGRAYIMKTKG